MQNDSLVASAPRREGVQAIARAGTLLRALEGSPDGLGLQELARVVGLPKSTVHRLVGALAAEELVNTAAAGKIRLGAGLVRLAGATRQTLSGDVRPVLESLHRQLDETVDLSVLEGAAARFVDQISATHRLRAVSAVGVSFPLHCTANGKALLAAMPTDQALELIAAGGELLSAHSRAQLLAELERIAQRGVAFDLEEHTEGICALGAAVYDATGPVAAISVPVPTPRFRGQEERYAQVVLAASREASDLLGGKV